MMPNDLPPEAHAYQKAWKKNQRALVKKGADRAYLYVHLEADSGEPFYIGMGETEGRPWSRRRSGKHKNRANKHGMRVDVDDMPCMSWELAGWWETRWIKAFRDAGYDLVNIADGGDGLSSDVAREVALAWRSRQTKEEKSEQALKIWESRRKNGTDKPRKDGNGASIDYIKSLETRAKNGTLTFTQDMWDGMSEDSRKDMGRRMSEGHRAAHEGRSESERAETKENRKRAAKLTWSDPGKAAEITAAQNTAEAKEAKSLSLKKTFALPEVKEQRSLSQTKSWAVAEIRDRRVKGIREANAKPEAKQKHIKSATEAHARRTPEEKKDFGRKISEGRKRAKEAREAAAKLSELKD